MPRRTIAAVLVVLVVLAGTISYTGFLVVGVVADYLGTSRAVAGLLLGGLFARFPWVSKGKLHVVGLLPQPVRRPLVISLLAFCLSSFLLQGVHVPAALTGFSMTFLLAYPWLRRAILDRTRSSFFKFAGRSSPTSADEDRVIDGEFKEKK